MKLTPKELKAIQMLAAGATEAQICERIGVSRSWVSRHKRDPEFQEAIKKAKAGSLKDIEIAAPSPKSIENDLKHSLRQLPQSKIEECRRKELELLDRIEERLIISLNEGSIRAAMALIRLSESRRKLLGIDIINFPVLNAVQILLHQGYLNPQQAEILQDGYYQMQSNLRILEQESSENVVE